MVPLLVALFSETLVTLTEASKTLPTHPHVATLWRWHKIGLRGRRLETVVVGGRRLTSLQALERFAVAVTADRDGIPATPPQRTGRQRRAAIAAAGRELDKAGVFAPSTKSPRESPDTAGKGASI